MSSALQLRGLCSYYFLVFRRIGISFRGGRRNKKFQAQQPTKRFRTNEYIRAAEVRVLDEEGALIGVLSRDEALSIAKQKELDLVEISPTAKPPVCKVIDYGKFLYAQQKKDQQIKKTTKTHEMKGIRLTFRIGEGDMERQRKKAEEFLAEGHPVRIQMMLRGREKAHKDLAFEKMARFTEALKEVGSLDQNPKMSGSQLIAILKPQKSSS